MTLQQIRYIVAIEECRSFSKAAERCFVSQPSISAMVRDLEEELGITIFHRERKGVYLTNEGKEFIRYAYQLLECEEMIRNRYEKQIIEEQKQFSVSSQHYSFVSKSFTEFTRGLSEESYDFRLRQVSTSGVISDVQKGRSEVGIMYISDVSRKYFQRVFAANNVEFEELATVPLHVFVAPDHPLAGKESVSAEDLESFPAILYDQEDDFVMYNEEMSILSRKPHTCYRITDLFTAILLMQQNQAYDLGTGLGGTRTSDLICSVPVSDCGPMTLIALKQKDRPLSAVGASFIAYTKDVIARESALIQT